MNLPTTLILKVDNQQSAVIDVFEGESELCSLNHRLGSWKVSLPPSPKGQLNITVTFFVNSNGLLKVTATIASLGTIVEAEISKDKGTQTDRQRQIGRQTDKANRRFVE